MGEAPSKIRRDATHVDPDGIEIPYGPVTFKRDLASENGGGSNHSKNWPIECFSSGVNAAQAPELRAFFKERGFDCEVTRDGDPVYTSPNHRRAALKLRNMHDRASYC